MIINIYINPSTLWMFHLGPLNSIIHVVYHYMYTQTKFFHNMIINFLPLSHFLCFCLNTLMEWGKKMCITCSVGSWFVISGWSEWGETHGKVKCLAIWLILTCLWNSPATFEKYFQTVYQGNLAAPYHHGHSHSEVSVIH